MPTDLEALLMQCLAKDPDDRPDSALALRARLHACADAGSWSEDDARRWWDAHEPKLTVGKAATVLADSPLAGPLHPAE